ncbi:cytochrome P450 [Amycolatopsis rhabdoformis]|uniref:Cytochrome P450 n=1 Tax=Amycolatopsis rhabdoformis TaxID=1448059 RepID=A0ABZ1IJQ3_9PSEU|nr:cytochrome P450 [Amycolatopsis rhabdoformis]WSE34632.1 cytochrome P450 [Amycolatopsis rhabdoformis]
MTAVPQMCPFDLTGRSVHEDADRLRERGPAVRVDLSGGVTAWSVTRYDVVKSLAADPRASRDARQHWPHLAAVPADWPLAPFLIAPTVLNAYGPDHTRLRTIMEAAFTPQRTQALETRLRERLRHLLDELTEAGDLVDLRDRYASVVACETLSDLFGVAPSAWPEMTKVIGRLLAPSDDPEEASAGLGEVMEFLGALIAAKRDTPGDDLATTLAEAAELTEEERVLALAVTIAGGVPSTTGLITNAIFALATHPDQLAGVLKGRTRWDDVLDETLRADSPVQHMPLRYAVEDIDLGEGVFIRRGEAILLGFGAVGRDPRVHSEAPGTFDARRPAKDHLAFGHGVHRCIAGALGLAEATVAVSALFERFPDLALAEPADRLDPLPTIVFSGKARLPVRLNP